MISSEKVGISKSKFVIFTTSASVAAKAKEKLSAIKLIDLRPLQNVGKSKDMNKVVTEVFQNRH